MIFNYFSFFFNCHKLLFFPSCDFSLNIGENNQAHNAQLFDFNYECVPKTMNEGLIIGTLKLWKLATDRLNVFYHIHASSHQAVTQYPS